MALKFSTEGWEDYQYWLKTDKETFKRVQKLIKATMRDPEDRSGHAERLVGDLSGWCSKRINREHRMVYRIKDGTLEIIQLRYHY